MSTECGEIPTALIMSKIDLKNERKISDEEAEKLAKELKILKGYFKAGKAINGACIMYYGDGDNDYLNFAEESVYEGFYRNGKRDGYGMESYGNNDKFEFGVYSQGKMIRKINV